MIEAISSVLVILGAVLFGAGFCENIKFSEKIFPLKLALIYLVMGIARVGNDSIMLMTPAWVGILIAIQTLTPSDEARLPRKKLYQSLSLRVISAVLFIIIGVLSIVRDTLAPVALSGILWSLLSGMLWLFAGATYFVGICLIMRDMHKFKNESDY